MALQDPGFATADQLKAGDGIAGKSSADNSIAGNSAANSNSADLGVQISKLSDQINANTYQLLKLIAEFDSSKGWAADGARCCADWLNMKCGLAASAARERVRVASRLDKLPVINKAFEKG